MNKRTRPIPETAAIEERKFRGDIRDFFKAMANDSPPPVGPVTFPVSYSELPIGSRVAVIRYYFHAGNSAQIWPEGDEAEKVELEPESGELDMPVGPSRAG